MYVLTGMSFQPRVIFSGSSGNKKVTTAEFEGWSSSPSHRGSFLISNTCSFCPLNSAISSPLVIKLTSGLLVTPRVTFLSRGTIGSMLMLLNSLMASSFSPCAAFKSSTARLPLGHHLQDLISPVPEEAKNLLRSRRLSLEAGVLAAGRSSTSLTSIAGSNLYHSPVGSGDSILVSSGGPEL